MDGSTPGRVGGARSRSPGVGAEVTSELSQHPLLDTPSTGWNENNTQDEVNDSTDWVRQLDYLLVNSWTLQSSSDFSEALLSQHPMEQGSERFEALSFEALTFEALTGDMSESMATDLMGNSQNSLVTPEILYVRSKQGIGTKMLNGNPKALALSQHTNGEMSLSQHPMGELSLSQHPVGELSLSQHPVGELSLSQHPIGELSVSQHPNGKPSLSQHPVGELSLSQHPIGDLSQSQHPNGEGLLLHRETSLSQYPLVDVSDLTEKAEMSSLLQHTIMSEESPIIAGNIITQDRNAPHRPVADEKVGGYQQIMTSGYSSLVTVASQSSSGQYDNFASLKSDVASVDHETVPRANGKDGVEENLMGSGEIVGHVTIYKDTVSPNGSTEKRKVHSKELCKPSKAESEGNEFDSGHSESSLSSQSQPSVVGVETDNKVAIAGKPWSDENATPDLMVDTPTDGVALQRSKVRQPVCTSTPFSGNESGGSREHVPQRTLIKQQDEKHSLDRLDSLIGQGPDSGCASLAPSIIAGQSCVSSVDAPSQPAPSAGDPYMSVDERERLLVQRAETSVTGGATGQFTADKTLGVATVCDNEMLVQAMTSYEDELIKTANELGISTEITKAELIIGHAESTDGHAPVDTEPQNAERSFTIYDDDEDPARSTTDEDPIDQKILQNGISQDEFRHLEQATLPNLETAERLNPSPTCSTRASLVHSGSLSGDSGMSRSSGALAEMVRSLTAGIEVPEGVVGSRGIDGSFSSHLTSPEPLNAMLTEKSHDDLQKMLSDLPVGHPQGNLQTLHDTPEETLHNRSSHSITDAIFNLPDKTNSRGSAETSSTTSGATLGSMDKDVERIANEYIAILKGGVQVDKPGEIGSETGSVSVIVNGGGTFSQYSDSSATTYNELPRISETAAKIADTHTVIIVTENANGSIDGSTHSSSSDTEDALDRDVRRILAKYGRTLSDDEDGNSSKGGKKKRISGTLSDSDDASSLSRRVHHLLNSGTETVSTVQPLLYLYDDPARSMSIHTGSSSSPNSAVASLKQAVQVAQDGVRDGARMPSPQSIQSADSLGQRVQNLLVGPDSRTLPLKQGHASSISSQSSVIDYTNLERELDEIQSSLASITSADGLRSRHGSISSQVSENVKTVHTMDTVTNLAGTYTFEKGTDGDRHTVLKAALSETSDKSQKFSVNPMLTSGLVPVDVALDIMHGTAADNQSTRTVPSHRSAGDNSAIEDQTSLKGAYGLDRNNSNAARDSSMYSSDNDGDSVRLMGNDQVQDVSRLVAEILERGSPPRQAYRYLHEAEEHERSLNSRKSLGDHSTDLLQDDDLLTRSHVSATVATPSGAAGTTSNSFNISPLSYTPLNAFRTANNLFSTQLSKFGVESVSPTRQRLQDMSPSVSQKMVSSGTEGEGRLQDEDMQLAFDRKRMSAMSVESRAEDRSFGKVPIEREHRHSPFRGQSTFVDTPVSTTRDATVSRYSSILPDTTSLTAKTMTSSSRPRSAIRAREYERELERTSAASSGPSVLERRPKSSSPMLRPYKPVGSQEYYYVESWVDDGSISVAMSEATVESTHAGSDDARAPPFPPYVLGSRKDTPQNTTGIYSHHRSSPSREMSPSGGQRLGTIPEQSFESRDTDVAQKQELTHPPPEVTLDKERSFHQTREWLNSGSFASRRHNDEADTSGSVAAQNSSAASADVASVNRRTLSPPGGRHDLLNSTIFATPQKYGTSFHSVTSSPLDRSLVDSAGRKRFEEKVAWKRDKDSSMLHHAEYHRRCHSVKPYYSDSQGYTRSEEVTTRRCYSETPNDRNKFSPLPIDEIRDEGRKGADPTPRTRGAEGDNANISSPPRFRGSTGQLASNRSSLPTGQTDRDDRQHSQVLATRFQSHLLSAERNKYVRPERPRSTGSMLEESQGRMRKSPNRYLTEQRSSERCVPGTRVIGERSRLMGGGDLDASLRYTVAEAGDTLKSDVTTRHRAAIYEQHADVMSRLQVSPPRDRRRVSDWERRERERSRESPELDLSRRSRRTADSTVDDMTRPGRSVNATSLDLVSDSMKEDGHSKHLAAENRHDTRYDVTSTRDLTLTHDTPLTRDMPRTRDSPLTHDMALTRDMSLTHDTPLTHDMSHDPMSTRDTNLSRDHAMTCDRNVTNEPINRRDPPSDTALERNMTRQPVVTIDAQHDPSLPLGINELWRRFQQIETTLDMLRSTSNSDTSRIIQLLQSQVHTQNGSSNGSSPLRIDIPAREFQRSSPGGTSGGARRTDSQRHTSDRIEGRNMPANDSMEERSKPSSGSYRKTPDRGVSRSGLTSEARRVSDRNRGEGTGERMACRDSGSKTHLTENKTRNREGNTQDREDNRQSHERKRQSYERGGQSHERNGESHERNGQGNERNGQSHERNMQGREGAKQGREENISQNNKGGEKEGDKRRPPPPDWTDEGGDRGRREKPRPAGAKNTGSQGGGVEGKTKKTAWLIKDETLLSIPEDTTLDSLSSDFTTTTAALSTTSDLDIDGRHVVVVKQTSKRHLPDDPRLLRLQQKIWRQKEMHRREQQREKRRREKIHKLERLLAEKAQQRIAVRGGTSDTPSTGTTDSLDTVSDVTTVTMSAQLSDDGGSSTLVEDDDTSTEVMCICHCMKSTKSEPKTAPITLQEVDYIKSNRKVNREQRYLEPESVTVHRSKRRSPSRRSEDAENQPRQHSGGKKRNDASGQRDFGATFPSPMQVSPAVRRTRLEGDVVMVSEAVQTSRPTSPADQNGGDKGGSGDHRQPFQSFLNPPPYGKMRLTLEKAKLLAAAVDDASSMTAHPGGFSWFIPVTRGEKPWGKREPLREFQENVSKDAWPPRRPEPRVDSENIDRIMSGKQEEIFAPFNQWTIEKPEKKYSLQEAFSQKMQQFISHSHERVRHMGLKAEERHVQELHRFERVRLFGTACGGNVLDEKLPRSSCKTSADPYAEHLFKPRRRSVTKHEMKRRTDRVYKRVSEMTAQVQEKKRQESYKTNRLRAQLYKQKILNQVLNKRGPLIE